MRKDYAKKNMFAQKRKLRKEPPRLSVLLTVFLVAFAVSVTGYWMYAHHGFRDGSIAWIASAKSLFVKHKADPVKVAKQQDSNQDDNNIRFDFYTELPKMQVNTGTIVDKKPFVSPKLVEKLPRPAELAEIDNSIQSIIATKKSQIKPSVQYTLQLGVFKDQLSASQLRLSLLLAGIDADVVKMQNNTYRVQKGSYTTENQAKSMQRQINKKGFDSEIKPIG
jgi:cell division protein FtsN